MPDVYLYIYDLSKGFAKEFSPMLLGKRVEGIWHTSTVLYNKEFFFCQSGIQFIVPGTSDLGQPLRKLNMGETKFTERQVFSHVRHLGATDFKPGDYSLFEHNCNTFSERFVFDLTRNHIPRYIMELPTEILRTSIGQGLKSALESLTANAIVGSSIEPEQSRPRIDHSFRSIKNQFRPILFDEPLSSGISSSRINLLWPNDRKSSSQASKAVMVYEYLKGVNPEANLNPEYFSLLALDKLVTKDQCQVVCELFRVAIWRDPNILMALLTDPNRYLHKFASVSFPPVQKSEVIELQIYRAKLLTNCIGLCGKWALMDDPHLRLDLAPIVHICLKLISQDSHTQRPSSRIVNHESAPIVNYESARTVNYESDDSDDDSTNSSNQTSEKRIVGLALAHNLALYPNLRETNAMELGSNLLYSASSLRNISMDSIEFIYMLRAIYFLIVRFEIVLDMAKAIDFKDNVERFVRSINQVHNRARTSRSRQSSSYKALGAEPDQPVSVDRMVADYLLDYLSRH